jgi:peptidyl-prolyl cis-trans isomerase SurA
MVYPFENAAYNTPVKELSQPIRTTYGYHLVYVNERSDALGTAQVAHIFVSLPPNSSLEDSAAAAEKINNIYQKIQDGMAFEEAANQYSDDKGSARNGGRLSKFTCNRIVPEFVVLTKQLEINEISEPVQTMYGYHIVKLISRETPGTFEEEAPDLKERLQKDNRSHKSEEAVIARIKSENDFRVNEKAKVAMFAAIDTAVLNNAFVADSLSGMNKTLIRLGKEKYSQKSFAAFIEDNQTKQSNIDKDVYLEKLFQKYVNSKCIEYENARLEENYPDFKMLMKEYHDGILLFNLTDEKVWSKAVEDTVGLEKFFKENNTNYKWDERVDATIYEIRNKDDVEKVKSLVTTLDSDGDIAEAIANDSLTSVTILPGKYERGDNMYIDKAEWKKGNVAELSSDVEDLVVIVKIREILEPSLKELNEARGLATADYQEFLEKEWVKQLKVKYPVVVNEEILQQLVVEN